MSRLTYHPTAQHKLPLQVARNWTPTLGTWGVGAGLLALFLLSSTPLVKREVLVKVPVVGSYWEDKTPASDKPF